MSEGSDSHITASVEATGTTLRCPGCNHETLVWEDDGHNSVCPECRTDALMPVEEAREIEDNRLQEYMESVNETAAALGTDSVDALIYGQLGADGNLYDGSAGTGRTYGHSALESLAPPEPEPSTPSNDISISWGGTPNKSGETYDGVGTDFSFEMKDTDIDPEKIRTDIEKMTRLDLLRDEDDEDEDDG